MMQLAGQYAPQITAPSVPAICADLRRIVDAIPASQASSPLSATIAQVSEQFSNSPVVVSAGRPNQCETAFLRIATLRGARSTSYSIAWYERSWLAAINDPSGSTKRYTTRKEAKC